MMKCCFNRKVLYSLGALGVAIFLFAPSARHYLPVLASLACPLSMVAMMGGMNRAGAKKNATAIPTTTAWGPGPVSLDPNRAKITELRAQIAELEATDSRGSVPGSQEVAKSDA